MIYMELIDRTYRALICVAVLTGISFINLILLPAVSHAEPELTITDVSFDKTYVKPNTEVEVTATVKNTGDEELQNVIATLKWPDSFTLMYDEDIFPGGDGAEDYDLGDLAPDEQGNTEWTVLSSNTDGSFNNMSMSNGLKVKLDADEIFSTYKAYAKKTLIVDGLSPVATGIYTSPYSTSVFSINEWESFINREEISWMIDAKDPLAVNSYSYSGIKGYRVQALKDGVWQDVYAGLVESIFGTYICPNGQTCSLRAQAIDRAGNASEFTQARKWTVDTLPPEVLLEGPQKWPAGEPLKVEYKIEDRGVSGLSYSNVKLYVSKTDTTSLPLSGSGVLMLLPGQYNRGPQNRFHVEFSAYDRAGNASNVKLPIYGEMKKPGLKIVKASVRKRAAKGRKRAYRLTVVGRINRYATGKLTAKAQSDGYSSSETIGSIKPSAKGVFKLSMDIPRPKKQISLLLELKKDKYFLYQRKRKKIKINP